MDKAEIYDGLNEVYFSEDCHEKELIRTLGPMFEGVRLFVDVGASLGQFTKLANEHMRNGEIVAIEADPIRVEELERNCARWREGSTNRLSCVYAALCDREGTVTFHTTESTVSGGLFEHPTKSPVEFTELEVPARTLDDLCADRTPDLVKMDVEGAELRALKGAQKVLARGKTTLLVEVHSWGDPERAYGPDDVLSFMQSLGYKHRTMHGKYVFEPARPQQRRTSAMGRVASKLKSALGFGS